MIAISVIYQVLKTGEDRPILYYYLFFT